MGETHFKCPEGWQMYRTVLYKTHKDPKKSTKFAIYDMDNTLMITPSYYVGDLIKGVPVSVSKPVLPNDFALYSPNVREKLLEELANGRGILIISNQKGIMDNLTTAYIILDRIELLLKELDVPLYIFLATRNDIYRKPAPGMLLYFEKYHNGGLKIDRSNSFYVGDAAGRRLTYKLSSLMLTNILKVLKKKDFSDHKYYNIDDKGEVVKINASSIINKLTVSKMINRFLSDFSDCDYKFALNNSINFYTPEEYFYDFPAFKLNLDFEPSLVGSDPFFPTVPKGLIVLIGNVCSGKTYLSKNCATNFTRVSANEFESQEEFMRVLEEKLREGEDVVVEDTNHLSSERVKLVQLASSLKVQVTYVHLDLSKNLINHLNKIKKLCSDESTFEYFDVPKQGGQFYNKSELSKLKVQKPTLDEGPDVIYTITDDCFPMDHNKLTSIHLP